jgi:hypothetical protein
MLRGLTESTNGDIPFCVVAVDSLYLKDSISLLDSQHGFGLDIVVVDLYG